jgi:hypothetical protein
VAGTVQNINRTVGFVIGVLSRPLAWTVNQIAFPEALASTVSDARLLSLQPVFMVSCAVVARRSYQGQSMLFV